MGVSVLVLERQPGPPTALRGETIQPNGQQILARLGLLSALTPEVVEPVRRFHFIRIGGERLCTMDYGTLPEPYNRALVALSSAMHHLVALYQGAQHTIYLATYGLTYPPVVRALIAAKKRGVEVRVITDRGKLDDRNQRAALETLRLAGVPIKVNRHDGLMHMKQVVVDDRVNTSGSMNQTSSAAFYNDERLDILHDAASTLRAKEKFLKMWDDHTRYQDW